MCTLCLSGNNNPFAIRSHSNLEAKKSRAKEIKALLKSYEVNPECPVGKQTAEKLKEEQYKLAQEI